MSNILVAYFSASGVTKHVAEKLASVTGADLFEIVPEFRYTKEDLDWTNKHSRSTIEMKDRTCRPLIASRVENMAQYNVVFVGFPIWWYREPSLIDTFLEAYDFGGKTIVPFATSGGSDLGEVPKNMQSLVENAVVTGGKRFAASVSDQELKVWADAYL
ncbi:MAG: NAD(P)H-dependent oxidoreductase [Anaerolineaceae bacterium]|nr:NAD(P)H-dependent oxidoreductase [Anaerolineaceae bacterium]